MATDDALLARRDDALAESWVKLVNIRPNTKFTSLKYIEHNVLFHPFQRTNKKFITTLTDHSAVFRPKHLPNDARIHLKQGGSPCALDLFYLFILRLLI